MRQQDGRNVQGRLERGETRGELLALARVDDGRLAHPWIDDQVGVDGEEPNGEATNVHEGSLCLGEAGPRSPRDRRKKAPFGGLLNRAEFDPSRQPTRSAGAKA